MTVLKSERLKRGWTLQRMGMLCDQPLTHLSAIERRLEPVGPLRSERICSALGMQPNTLFETATGLARLADEV